VVGAVGMALTDHFLAGRSGEVDAEQGVVAGQSAQRDDVSIAVATRRLAAFGPSAFGGQVTAHGSGGGLVLRVGDHLMPGPAAGMAGDDAAPAEHHDLSQGRGDVDEPADYPRIHGVVAACGCREPCRGP
jgi:hypothetical protein